MGNADSMCHIEFSYEDLKINQNNLEKKVL